MPDWLSIHEPVLVNTIGHCAGAVIFGMLLYFFLVNRRRASDERSSLPAMAAGLAMLWNLGSLVALETACSARTRITCSSWFGSGCRCMWNRDRPHAISHPRP